MTPHTTTRPDQLDLITHSPDGESRGLISREGDIFPLNPAGHILSASDTPASTARPWGLRFLTVPKISAGKHEGGTNETTGTPDGDKPAPEETQTD